MARKTDDTGAVRASTTGLEKSRKRWRNGSEAKAVCNCNEVWLQDSHRVYEDLVQGDENPRFRAMFLNRSS